MKNPKKILQIFKKAEKENFAIAQFNFSTLSQFWGIIKTAKANNVPFILGTSEGESNYIGLKTATALLETAKEKYKINAFLNLDHAKSFNYIKKAIETGYDMVHFDGSSLPLERNITETKKIVSFAKKRGVIVEGELGHIKGHSTLHKREIKILKEELTSPDIAKEFVKKTGVNLLAVSIGSFHGIYKKEPHLDLERLFMIKNKVGQKAFLVLHGGSGIKDSDIKKAIKGGIRKININTELRIAWKKGIEKAVKKPDEITPYKILPIVEKEVQKVVNKKIKLIYFN